MKYIHYPSSSGRANPPSVGFCPEGFGMMHCTKISSEKRSSCRNSFLSAVFTYPLIESYHIHTGKVKAVTRQSMTKNRSIRQSNELGSSVKGGAVFLDRYILYIRNCRWPPSSFSLHDRFRRAVFFLRLSAAASDPGKRARRSM